MIPLKIELKNFLSYGSSVQTIDFQNHSLICLSGRNGNGKSALLDALTWAVWGNARKISGTIKADAGLIRLGQTQMMVCLEFISNGNTYRIRREYAKTYGRPYVSLDLSVFDEAMQSYRSLTEKTVRQTQEKIEKTIGLDFDTFVNSAFLRQGQSDEFSTKSPKERKQILSSILGLSQYDALQKCAIEKGRICSDERALLIKMHEIEGAELGQEDEKNKALAEANKEIKNIDEVITSKTHILEKHHHAQKTYQAKREQYAVVINDKKNNDELLTERQRALGEIRLEWKQIHRKLINSDDGDALEKEHKRLMQKEQNYRKAQEENLRLKTLLLEAHNRLHTHKVVSANEQDQKIKAQQLLQEKYELQVKQLDEQIAQKEKIRHSTQEKQQNIAKELQSITKELSCFKEFSKEFDGVKKQFEKRRSFFHVFVQRGNSLQQLLREIEQKKQVIHDRKNPSCPLCEQVLTVRRKQFLARTIISQEMMYRHRLQRVTGIIKTLKALLLDQHKDIEKCGLQHEHFAQLQMNKEHILKKQKDLATEYNVLSTELESYLAQKKQKEHELADVKKVVSILENEKTTKVHAAVKKITQEIAKIEDSQKKHFYDQVAHEALKKQIIKVEDSLKCAEELKRQKLQQSWRQKRISELCVELKRLNAEDKAIKKRIKQLDFDPSHEKHLTKIIANAESELQSITKKREQLVQVRIELETVLKRFESLRKAQQNRGVKLKKLDEQIKDYQSLAMMFGKDGIQALLIDQAIPEIEAEANILLSRLTDNKSQIFIESLRDLKKGGVKESLDIHISDAVGIRPYEMFSGGEAFRIDFVLRIAISKLLARRAGATLQTLIIDEGFGSQDEEGLQRLMDVLYAVQDDFAKIIVVSHLSALKDSFPVHFIVNKDSMGSFVTVEERG